MGIPPAADRPGRRWARYLPAAIAVVSLATFATLVWGEPVRGIYYLGPRNAYSVEVGPQGLRVATATHFVLDVPTALFLAPPLAVVCLTVVAQGRRDLRCPPSAGVCAACGYDLRASPGRCPECGAEPKKGVPS